MPTTMEGVEIGNEIGVWAGRVWIIDDVIHGFHGLHGIQIVPHAKARSRKEPISTDYADFRRLGQTLKCQEIFLTGFTGLTGFNFGSHREHKAHREIL
jgi:hypothetical protein